MLGPLLLAAGILLAQTEATPGDQLRLEVRRLVRQLDAPRLTDREQAEQELIRLGPDVLDLLPQVTDRMSAEVQQRLERIRHRLQRAMVESALEPTRVTLEGDALPLSEILSAIQQQTANKIVDLRGRFGQPVSDPPLKVAFKGTPFWQALDEVLDQARLSIYPYGEQKAVRLTGSTDSELSRSGRASYSGPFRFQPVRIEAVRDLRDPANQSLRLTLEIAWEPRLAPISLRQSMADVEAVDETGNPLPVADRQAELEVPVNPDSIATQLTIPLLLPPRTVSQIARLKGKVTALVPGKIETFRFKDLQQAKNVPRRAAGATVILEQVRKNNQLWEVRVRVGFDKASGALESHRLWIYQNEAYLEGPDGKPIPYGGSDVTRQGENEVGIAYYFAVDGPLTDHTFVYKTPGMILSREFDYQFGGIELP